MEKVRLLYRETPQTDGVPQLEDPTGKLSHDELRPWEAELARCYQHLAQCDGQLIVFAGKLADLPTRYRVRVRPVKNRRCPVLELLDAEDSTADPTAPDVPVWLGGFLEAADCLLRGATGDRAERTALSFVLEELRELDQSSRDEVTVLLLAGYLYMAETQCSGLSNATERVALYRLASRALDAWCAGHESAPGSVSRPAAGGTSGSQLAYQWMPRMLIRLLGLNGENTG